MRDFSNLGPTLYLDYEEFRKYIDGTYFSAAFFWADNAGYYQVITEQLGGVTHETNIEIDSADGYDFEVFFRDLPPRTSFNQLAASPLIRNIFLEGIGLEEGNIELNDDTWNTFASTISAIKIVTNSENYNLYLTTNDQYDTNDLKTVQVVTNGFQNLLVQLNLEFLSETRSLYFVIEDLEPGPNTFDLFISGQARS